MGPDGKNVKNIKSQGWLLTLPDPPPEASDHPKWLACLYSCQRHTVRFQRFHVNGTGQAASGHPKASQSWKHVSISFENEIKVFNAVSYL